MVLVSLNLNEYHMPTGTVSVWTLHNTAKLGFSWLNLYKLVILDIFQQKFVIKYTFYYLIVLQNYTQKFAHIA